jgi:hypothetical protein
MGEEVEHTSIDVTERIPSNAASHLEPKERN